jgi:glutathione S-transferase
MQRVQIIGAPFSSYVWIVRMALEEKQVPYDLIPERMHSAEVLPIHPFGKIPVMRHGDVTLWLEGNRALTGLCRHRHND